MSHVVEKHALVRAFGGAVCTGVVRSQPEDFYVEEIDSFAASGVGEHLLLTIEKKNLTTAFAAKQLALWAGVKESAIGYAGLKDRHAVTRQRFSVHLPKRIAPDIGSLESSELHVLRHDWHAKKLPRGALAGNRFGLILRKINGNDSAIEKRLDTIATLGLPNYFGEQRFGRNGDNASQALAMFQGQRVRREQRTMLLSAARSELFNRVLNARVRDASWNLALDGDVWILDGSRSIFGPQPFDEILLKRLSDFDIHPSGPLWGRGDLRTRDKVSAIENSVLSDGNALALRTGLEAAGLKQERRSLRLRPKDLNWSWLEGGTMKLSFELPPGSYATTVLSELGDFKVQYCR